MSHASDLYVKHLRLAPNGEKITPSEKSVLMQLSDDHREGTGAVWTSMKSLADRACMSTRNCRRVMRELERKKVIETTPNLREKDGGQTSNEIRICAIDPEFNRQSLAMVAKRMQFQKVQRIRAGVQQKLYPPDTVVRGGRTPKSGGGGRIRQGGADTDVRAPRTPSSALELLVEPLLSLEGSSDGDPKSNPPTPLQKRKGAYLNRVDEHGTNERFDRLKLMLKSELLSIPGNLAGAKGFTEILPGQNDYVTCFEYWFLEEIKALPNGLLIVTWTHPEHQANVAAGLEKYRERLVRLARRYFEEPDKPVSFKLLAQEAAAPAALPMLAPEPGTIQRMAATADPQHVAQDAWSQVKDELERAMRAARPSPLDRSEFEKNFDDAIRPVRLLQEDRAGGEAIWKLQAPNAKKTRAVLALYRQQLGAAITAVTGGSVQLMVL